MAWGSRKAPTSRSRSSPVLQLSPEALQSCSCLLQVSNTSRRSASMFPTCGQIAGVHLKISRFPHPRALPKILSKITFERNAPRLSKMIPEIPKSTPKSIKLEPGNLQLVFPMLFCRTLVLNDNYMNFMVFQVPGIPELLKSHPNQAQETF